MSSPMSTKPIVQQHHDLQPERQYNIVFFMRKRCCLSSEHKFSTWYLLRPDRATIFTVSFSTQNTKLKNH